VCPRVGLITRTAGDWQGTGGKAAESRAPWRRLRLTSVRFRGAPRYETSRCPPLHELPPPGHPQGDQGITGDLPAVVPRIHLPLSFKGQAAGSWEDASNDEGRVTGLFGG
jgi:hypothetical protein